MASSHVHHQLLKNKLTNPQKLSLIYHNVFDYALSDFELKNWQVVNKNIILINPKQAINSEEQFNKKQARYKISQKKLIIAEKAANLLSKIPSIKFIGLTGSLAMMNSKSRSDIDFLIITRTSTLWLTRPFVYLLLFLSGFSIRKPGDEEEADRLCINMWLDENDLVFKQTKSHLRNLFLAHEVLQIRPLVNKNETYEKLLSENKWVYEYWKGESKKTELLKSNANILIMPINLMAYYFQKLYMKRKLTREVVTTTRAFFHPVDWSKKVEKELIKRGVKEEAG